MSTGKGWEGDDCTCGGENSRWKGLQARAHHEPLSPGGGMAASGADGGGRRRPYPLGSECRCTRQKGLELTRLVQREPSGDFPGGPVG